jgi:hypothetical protein
MKSKTRGRKEEVALKLDISKTYDRIEWDYLRNIMSKMGFSHQWIVDYALCRNGGLLCSP